MRAPGRAIKVLFGVFLGFFIWTGSGMAGEYPNKPVQIIVPSPAGGSTDIAARIFAAKLAVLLGQPVITVNKPGGGGALAAKIFASATEPDGYTILAHWPAIALIPILNPDIGFKMEDFIAVAQPISIVYLIAVKADSPWKTFDEFIRDARKNPGKLTYASGGIGGGYHFTAEHLKIETGTDIVHVPMEGDAAAVTAVLGGHVDMVISSAGLLSGYLKGGDLRALGNMYHKRIKEFPDIPTIRELGYPSLTTQGWLGFFLPAKTPREVVEKLGKAFETAMNDKEVMDQINKVGMVVQNVVLGEATKFFRDEDKRWRRVAEKAGMIKETVK
jgi:tripartite-type tricarboxylate transporter receptor subunit TctC